MPHLRPPPPTLLGRRRRRRCCSTQATRSSPKKVKYKSQPPRLSRWRPSRRRGIRTITLRWRPVGCTLTSCGRRLARRTRTCRTNPSLARLTLSCRTCRRHERRTRLRALHDRADAVSAPLDRRHLKHLAGVDRLECRRRAAASGHPAATLTSLWRSVGTAPPRIKRLLRCCHETKSSPAQARHSRCPRRESPKRSFAGVSTCSAWASVC